MNWNGAMKKREGRWWWWRWKRILCWTGQELEWIRISHRMGSGGTFTSICSRANCRGNRGIERARKWQQTWEDFVGSSSNGSAMAEDYIVSAADNLIPPPRLRHQYGVFSCRVLSCTLFFPKTIFSVRIVHGASTHSSVWTRNMQQMHSKYTKCRCVASVGVPTCENVTFTGAACVTSHRTCN